MQEDKGIGVTGPMQDLTFNLRVKSDLANLAWGHHLPILRRSPLRRYFVTPSRFRLVVVERFSVVKGASGPDPDSDSGFYILP